MKILLINQTWFAPELRSFGHEVLSCGFDKHLDVVLHSATTHINTALELLPKGFSPDRIVWFDNSAPMSILGLEDCPIPSVFYSVDTHHHYVLHSYLANSFDHILIAQKDFMPSFSVRHTPCTWFPLWASQHLEPSHEKKYGAVFVGTLRRDLNPERVDFFEKLGQLIPITVMQGHFPSIFPHAEIVVNQAVKGDLNFRVFESMMSGALLLTEKAGHGLLELFKDGEHLVTYSARDAHDAAAKITDLLNNPQRMRQIASDGRDEILRAHLPLHRASTLEGILLGLKKLPRDPRRHYGAAMNLYSMASVFSESHPGFAVELLRLGLASVRNAITEGATVDATEAVYVARTCLRFDLLSGEEEGANTLLAFSEAFPHLEIFALLKIRALLNKGLTAEAREYASRIAANMNPGEIFSAAEHTASQLICW